MVSLTRSKTPSKKKTPEKKATLVTPKTPKLIGNSARKISSEKKSIETGKSQTPLKKSTNGAIKKTPKSVKKVATLESDETYVSIGKLEETLKVLVQVVDNHKNNAKKVKSELFEDDSNFVYVNLLLKKTPSNYSTYVHSIPIPFHWRHDQNFETCLIVQNLHKEPLPNREADLEVTRQHYSDLLENKSAKSLISEILPLRQLAHEFKDPIVKKKLAKQYNAFLCDRKLMFNKFSFVSRFLGKPFWVDAKNVPVLIDMQSDDLKEQIEKKLDQTSLYMSGKGATLSVCVGSLSQDQNKLLKNIEVVLEKIHQVFSNNVRSLSLKTEKSMDVIFFLDLQSSNEVQLEQNKMSGEDFLEDDFDFLTNSNVRVYRDGNVRVLPRESSSNPEEDQETPDAQETEFIEQINTYVDNQWIRRKVNKLPKQKILKKKSSRLVKNRLEVSLKKSKRQRKQKA